MNPNFKKFVDLRWECFQLKTEDRISELSDNLPRVSITAIGGFPIIQRDGYPTWIDSLLTEPNFSYYLKQALGASAVLTYTNKSNKALEELGDLCVNKKHFWGLHWINLTVTLARYPLNVQMAFACDKNFYLSWPIEKIPTGRVFSATAGIKEWLDFIKHKDDLSFDPDTRSAMHEITRVVFDQWELK